jgi:glycosyltransferase involved in cell wall biosynthesis
MRAYNAADVLVHPSSYDSFGLVVAEAMACELPVVVGTEAGASEWIHDRRNGLVCADDRASVEAALRWLRDDPVRAAQVGRAARRTVESYSWDACAEATERVYARVAGGC